jgi:multiple sugar transport system permease protein
MSTIVERSFSFLRRIVPGRKKRLRQHNLAGYLFISPWLLGFFAFTLIPIIASLVLGFTDYCVLSPPKWVGLQNFRKMFFGDPRYWRSVKATLYFAFASVPLKLAFALAVAMLLNRGRRLLSLYRAVYYAPSIVGGSVAVAVMWREIFGIDGLLNSLLARFFDMPGLIWLGDPRTAIWSLILLGVWQFGSPMLIFLAGLKQIPAELYEAASIDGAGAWAKFTRITLPMLTPVIFFNLVMQIIFAFMVFTQAFIVTAGAPLDTTLFYSLYVYLRAFRLFEMGYGAAMAWVLLLTIAFFTALLFRSSSYWVHYAAKEERI